jgi:hypothetical protein
VIAHNHPHDATCTWSCPASPSRRVPRYEDQPGNVSPRPLRSKTSAERKAEPIHSGVLLYFPDALAAIARWSVIGNVKHNGAEAPLGWQRGKSMDQMDALTRHSLTRDAMDPDGELEAVPLAWRALAELQLLEEKRLRAAGIMPYSGVAS